MTNIDLAASYLLKATSRMRILPVLMEDENWSDVVREAQEIVELATKAILRRAGIDPPKWHDVSPIIIENLRNSRRRCSRHCVSQPRFRDHSRKNGNRHSMEKKIQFRPSGTPGKRRSRPFTKPAR